MKIAVWHNLPSGGGKRALFDHVTGLIAVGHTVESWCPPTADQAFLPMRSLVEEHVVALSWPVPSSRMEDFQFRLNMERQVAAMDAHCRLCAEEIDRGGFDIVLVNSCMFFRTVSMARWLRTPSVLYLQEPYRWLYEAMPEQAWAAMPAGSVRWSQPGTWRAAFKDVRRVRNLRVQMREEVANARAYRRILCNSYFSRESILRAYGLASEVCYLGVDTRHFVDAGRVREDFVAGLGSIVPEKNVEIVIRALGAMETPRPRLIWMGNMTDGAYRDEMRALAAELGVEADLRSGAPADEVVDVLQRAFAMVYAPRLEPFGLAPLEANACGTPVVAVREGGVRETIRHEVNGLLADATPPALAAAIGRLRDDQSLARRLGETGKELVASEWSVAAAGQRLERHLREVAQSPRSFQATSSATSARR